MGAEPAFGFRSEDSVRVGGLLGHGSSSASIDAREGLAGRSCPRDKQGSNAIGLRQSRQYRTKGNIAALRELKPWISSSR
jgi:hypothetical protein